MSLIKDNQKSIRVVLPQDLYDLLKQECPSYGDLSKLIRQLLIKHLEQLKEEFEDGPGSE